MRIVSELRGAFRALRAMPVVTLLAILSLVLGIGAKRLAEGNRELRLSDRLKHRRPPSAKSDRACSFSSAHPCISNTDAEIATRIRRLIRGHCQRIADFQADSPSVMELEKHAAADIDEGVLRSRIRNRFECICKTAHNILTPFSSPRPVPTPFPRRMTAFGLRRSGDHSSRPPCVLRL